MSRLTTILALSFFLFGLVLSLDDFLDCPGNDGFFHFFRRCCTSDDLPNGCECFDTSYLSPFTNSGFQLPSCPNRIDASFKLFNPSSKSGSIIKADKDCVSDSEFDPSLPTRVVTHGFTESGSTSWMLEMKDEFLKLEACNVILVDWKRGARAPNYNQAVANTRVVGAMIARLVDDLNICKNADFQDFHLIGHSLGAHVMGYAGEEIERLREVKLGRISGLDPAGPKFDGYSTVVKVDESDASFVDIIHTDAEDWLSPGQ
ncbi:pancreatic lipase-related protein 2-like [Aplysia californica]|uniref:Pancreatic lipase-related protein 2-like n=1 Tax=Aplysia californica TaxID=6500 RepID=A0ABM0JV43_APLCA|nr:pancreatic lipase-related protein 2-like [Aplysia californica]